MNKNNNITVTTTMNKQQHNCDHNFEQKQQHNCDHNYEKKHNCDHNYENKS